MFFSCYLGSSSKERFTKVSLFLYLFSKNVKLRHICKNCTIGTSQFGKQLLFFLYLKRKRLIILILVQTRLIGQKENYIFNFLCELHQTPNIHLCLQFLPFQLTIINILKAANKTTNVTVCLLKNTNMNAVNYRVKTIIILYTQ